MTAPASEHKLTAYERVMSQKLAIAQREQRAMQPRKVAQKFLRDWCGAQGFGLLLQPEMGADLIRRIEALILAERSTPEQKGIEL